MSGMPGGFVKSSIPPVFGGTLCFLSQSLRRTAVKESRGQVNCKMLKTPRLRTHAKAFTWPLDPWNP